MHASLMLLTAFVVSLVQASLVLLTAFGGWLSASQFGAVDSFLRLV